MKKIELLEIDLDDVVRVVTAVYRPEGIAENGRRKRTQILIFTAIAGGWWSNEYFQF